MPALIDSMMYVKETPWHGLGTYVGDENINSAQAIRAAGLDWEVEKREIFYQVGDDLMECPSHRAMVRTTDNKTFGVVGKGYEPVQNREAFDFLDGLVSDGSVRYHTAGALKGGAQIWLLAQLPNPIFITAEDKVERFLLLSNPHDGSGSCVALPTGVRVVCANTLALAHSQGRGKGLRFRHTRNIKARMANAQKAIKAANEAFNKFEDRAKALAAHNMNGAEWTAFTRHMFPDPAEDAKQATVTRIQNKRADLEGLFENGRGQRLKGVHHTAWAALNAVTEYKDHVRQTKGGQENRLQSAWFGSGDQFADQAFTWLQGLVTGDDEVKEQVEQQRVFVQAY